MLSFVRRPVLPPCPNPDTGTRGRVELPDDVVLTILEHAQLPPDRLAQLRRTSKQFKKICEGNALWRPWWSCAPRWPDDGAQAIGPSAIYDDMMRQPQRARKDFAQLGRLKNKPLYHFGRDEAATIARRNLDNQRVFFLAVEINPEVLQMAPPSWLRDEAAMTGAIA